MDNLLHQLETYQGLSDLKPMIKLEIKKMFINKIKREIADVQIALLSDKKKAGVDKYVMGLNRSIDLIKGETE